MGGDSGEGGNFRSGKVNRSGCLYRCVGVNMNLKLRDLVAVRTFEPTL